MYNRDRSILFAKQYSRCLNTSSILVTTHTNERKCYWFAKKMEWLPSDRYECLQLITSHDSFNDIRVAENSILKFYFFAISIVYYFTSWHVSCSLLYYPRCILNPFERWLPRQISSIVKGNSSHSDIFSSCGPSLANNEQRDRDQTRTMTEKDLKRETRREDIRVFGCEIASMTSLGSSRPEKKSRGRHFKSRLCCFDTTRTTHIHAHAYYT